MPVKPNTNSVRYKTMKYNSEYTKRSQQQIGAVSRVLTKNKEVMGLTASHVTTTALSTLGKLLSCVPLLI